MAISAIGLTENIPAAPFLSEYGSGHCSTHSDDNAPGSEDLHSFQGLIAHNALKGTTEQIHTTDRQVIVYRNSFPNSGYNVISSKRPVSNSLKWSPDNSSISCYSNKYYFLNHNAEFLSGGMMSASERIHLLRVLII